METYQYNKLTYEEAIKKKINNIISSTFYVEGYCDIPHGRVFFKGDIGGVSQAQARFYIIYMLRDTYGDKVWINPIFYKINKCHNKSIKDRELIFSLEEYEDCKIREFIRFNDNEIRAMQDTKRDLGHLMPRVVEGPLINLGIFITDNEVDNTSNKLITSNSSWNRDNLTYVIRNAPISYEVLDISDIVLKTVKIFENDELKDKILRVLNTSLDDYIPNPREIIKVRNLIYDINDLTDVLHYSKLVSIVDEANSFESINNLEYKLNSINQASKSIQNKIRIYKQSRNILELELVCNSYIQILNDLNEIYCNTYKLSKYEKTICSLCEIYWIYMNDYDEYLELQSYTLDNRYSEELNLLNEELLNSITTKIQIIIKQLMYSLIALYKI